MRLTIGRCRKAVTYLARSWRTLQRGPMEIKEHVEIQQLDELAFMSGAALRLGEIGPEEDIFEYVAEQLASIAPHTLVVTSNYEPRTGCTVVRGVAGPPDMRARIPQLLGREPLGLEFPVTDEARRAESRLVRLEGGLHELTFDTWPLETARPIEASLGLRSIHVQRFTTDKGDFVGTAAFLSQAEALAHERLIEAFTRIAAVAIQRGLAEAELRESESRFRMLAENSQDVIFRLRLKPVPAVEYVSPAATRLVGHTPQEIYADARLGEGSIYPTGWRSAETLRRLSTEPAVAHCLRSDGTSIWTEQNVTAIRCSRGEIVALEGIARDITKRKMAEDALLEADRRKTEFLAMLSHELRNPLGVIRNAAHVLGLADATGERSTRARAAIERQIVHLTRLIDDLLDVARIAKGKIQLRPERVDLNELVRLAVEDHRSTFESSGVEIGVFPAPTEVWVSGDRTRLTQIIGNLLENAAKFTPRGSRASVAVDTDEARKKAVLRVHNAGVRIAPDLVPHLFEPFVQADRTLDRREGGLGLGLSLVKGLAEMHAGSVEVDSDPEGNGTTFTIRAPLDTSAPASPHGADEPVAASSAPRRVLVIEDDLDAAETLRDALELHDNTVALAGSGLEGIETARTFKPDIVICDIGLPGMDGYAVARAMRADPELGSTSLVALTGYGSPEDVVRSREAGFDRHLAKPLSIERLGCVLNEPGRPPDRHS